MREDCCHQLVASFEDPDYLTLGSLMLRGFHMTTFILRDTTALQYTEARKRTLTLPHVFRLLSRNQWCSQGLVSHLTRRGNWIIEPMDVSASFRTVFSQYHVQDAGNESEIALVGFSAATMHCSFLQKPRGTALFHCLRASGRRQ